MSEYITVKQIAEQLNVGEETVRRWIRSGALIAVQNSKREGNLIDEQSFTEFLKTYTPNAATQIQTKPIGGLAGLIGQLFGSPTPTKTPPVTKEPTKDSDDSKENPQEKKPAPPAGLTVLQQTIMKEKKSQENKCLQIDKQIIQIQTQINGLNKKIEDLRKQRVEAVEAAKRCEDSLNALLGNKDAD